MDTITIQVSDIVYLLGIIVSIGAVWKLFKEFNQPKNDLQNKVEKHDELLDLDNKRLNEAEEINKLLCKGMLVLINHEITGNDVKNLKEVKTEMENYLINR